MFSLKKNGNYCQYWKNKTNDTLNPYHRSKSITFVKSFWFWKNELKSEYDEFVNPNSKIKIITLETVYEFNENKWHERTDTLRQNRSFCATGRKNAFKSEKTTKEKIKEKLESWNLK